MTDIADLLSSYKEQIRSAPRVLVGYSGGLDSSVLLAATAEITEPGRTLALHINHQIDPKADQWEEHCQSVAEALDVSFYSERIKIDAGSGVEEQARNARYRIFERLMGPKDILLLGHHADDQVETFLFRLFRGSGVKGLAAIPPQRVMGKGMLLRPLLTYSKQDLSSLATSAGIEWIEDPSNSDSQFDRNFIRNELLLLIKDRWTAADKQVLTAVDSLRDTDALLSEVADDDLRSCDYREETLGVSINITALNSLSRLRQDNLIRRFMYDYQGTQPNRETIHVLRKEVIEASVDAQPRLRQSNLEIRRFRNRLYLLPLCPEQATPEKYRGDWLADQGAYEIEGVWRITKIEGPEKKLRVDFRRGDERLKPQGRSRSQRLKKLLLEYEIEPWLRDWLPIIYCGDEIVAVGDRIQCSDFRFQMQWSIEQGTSFR